jgi:hypothetical protein
VVILNFLSDLVFALDGFSTVVIVYFLLSAASSFQHKGNSAQNFQSAF